VASSSRVVLKKDADSTLGSMIGMQKTATMAIAQSSISTSPARDPSRPACARSSAPRPPMSDSVM
jgi:hypothetical protein